jgi:hypothetical protein
MTSSSSSSSRDHGTQRPELTLGERLLTRQRLVVARDRALRTSLEMNPLERGQERPIRRWGLTIPLEHGHSVPSSGDDLALTDFPVRFSAACKLLATTTCARDLRLTSNAASRHRRVQQPAPDERGGVYIPAREETDASPFCGDESTASQVLSTGESTRSLRIRSAYD